MGLLLSFTLSPGLDENTLVVFSSDNGSGHSDANGSLRGKKGYVFEGGVRVPAFIQGTPLLQQMSVTPGYSSSALGLQYLYKIKHNTQGGGAVLSHLADFSDSILRIKFVSNSVKIFKNV